MKTQTSAVLMALCLGASGASLASASRVADLSARENAFSGHQHSDAFLGHVLLELEAITQEDLEKALTKQAEARGLGLSVTLEEIIAKSNLADVEQLPKARCLRSCVEAWIPAFEAENRNYHPVAVGCTGGQHRSVFVVEQLGQFFAAQRDGVLVRHREQKSLPAQEAAAAAT